MVRALLFVGAASAALAAGGPDALVPFRDVAGAATEVGVGVVIDFTGSAPTVSGCVHVPPTDTGYQALAAFVAEEGLTQPAYDSNGSGLLCSIDGIPTDGSCGQAISGGYQFWSYWYMTDGSGQWTYANRGASAEVGYAANGEDVEGWRFQNPGPDNASAPPPSVAPNYTSLCGAAPPPTTTTTAVPVATTVPPATTPPSTPAPPSGGGTGATTSKATGSAGTTHPATSVPARTRATAASGTTPSTKAPSGATTGPAPSGDATGSVTSGATKGPATAAAGSATADPSLHTTSATEQPVTGGSGLPAIVAALIVLALAGGAVFGWRRRSRTP